MKKTARSAQLVLEAGGLLVSEFPPDKKEDTFSVVKSCRIQAGLSCGLILVQSSLDGGSRFAVKSFSETPRPIAVINPVSSDFELPEYNANKELIENRERGLSKFAALGEEKIQTSRIFVVKSKDDYKEFENIVMNTNLSDGHNNSTLF